jgi:hypothetical protein
MPVQGFFRYLLPHSVDARFWFITLDRAIAAVADGTEAIEMSSPVTDATGRSTVFAADTLCDQCRCEPAVTIGPASLDAGGTPPLRSAPGCFHLDVLTNREVHKPRSSNRNDVRQHGQLRDAPAARPANSPRSLALHRNHIHVD